MRRRSLFLFVARNHFGFDAHRIANHAVHYIRRVRQDALRLAAHQPEQIGVGDHAMLDDFEQAGAIFALRQRVQHGWIDDHRQRLMKAADQVLAGGQVHAGFAADGRVHLRQQRGGNLNHRNPAHEDGGQESGDVGENAAAECDDDAGAVSAARDHLLGQRLHFRQALARFAAGEKQEPRVRQEQAPTQRRAASKRLRSKSETPCRRARECTGARSRARRAPPAQGNGSAASRRNKTAYNRCTMRGTDLPLLHHFDELAMMAQCPFPKNCAKA